ncbi:unnamed protein product [Polarella glacialis]|uniref:Cytochrome P450 n=1 Tax=Polarella glacialis TaxID=89957 RepID=A0A813FQ95_POLGL|nr:unnamed protein product [Polarella glacialis]
MAARLRALAAQLLPVPVAGPRAGVADVQDPRRKQLSPEAIQQFVKNVKEYVASCDKLSADGTLPTMTNWDLMQAGNHLGAVTSKRELIVMLDEAEAAGRLALVAVLPGPWSDAPTREERVSLIQQVQIAEAQGRNVQQIAEWQLRYGGQGLGSNIAVPMVGYSGAGSKGSRQIHVRIVVTDPGDAERLSRIHTRKEGNFESTLFDSIISTPDNDHWRRQRQHLAEAFMPLSSLAQILPASLDRAKHCAERLRVLAETGAVDMSDFLLHEAQAQLQVALMGIPESVMESTNSNIRSTFMGEPGDNEPRALAASMRRILDAVEADKNLALPSDGCPVKGPVSAAMKTSDFPASTIYGNVLLLLFAGHDTTGHTMTWFLFELARHPEIQAALQLELDEFFSGLAGRDPEYRDLSKLSLMDRCITETLRLWPAVANGTFRQLQFGDTVKGADGQEVKLPKGTLVHIVNWSRHRNPELWGASVDEFDPYRNFQDSELARVGCPLAGKTPQSDRFSPFAHAPRSCLGKNFAQMEMRLILANLLRHFSFSFAPPYDSLLGAKMSATSTPGEFRGVNRGTMGPLDLERQGSCVWGERQLYALKMHVHVRAH